MTFRILPSRSFSKNRGFSLLEVLISIVVLSFGVLGAAGLQATSLQANREARLQATAARFGEELAELMRGNKGVSIKTTNATDNPYLIALKSGDSDPTNPDCGYPGKSACTTGVAIAQRDIYEWWKRVNTELPGARVSVCEDNSPYETSSGLPQWTCSNSGGVLVLKIGWTRANTLRGATGTNATSTTGANSGAFDKALRPGIVFTVTPGSST